MILRMWRGYTAPGNADAYEAMLRETILPGLHRVSGYRGAYVARRNSDGDAEVEFITLTLWDSMDAVRAFSTAPLALMDARSSTRPPALCSLTLTSTQFTTRRKFCSLTTTFNSGDG